MSAGIRRLGVFGSAFDPPHLSHLALVQAALAQLQLDAVRVLPTGYAWHKTRVLSPAPHRLALTRAAFADEPLVVVDDRELHRPGPTYTIDTLRELQAEFAGAELVLILGGDQADAFPSWHRWQEIVQIATIAVAARGATSRNHTEFSQATPLSSLPGVRSCTLALSPTSLSATEVRQRVAAGLPIDHMVPSGVGRYIEHNHLYQTT